MDVEEIVNGTTYDLGGVHPIIPVPGSKWLVVGHTRNPAHAPGGSFVSSYDIHFNDDDPNERPIDPDEWNPLDGGKKFSADLYRRHTKSVRLALRRAVDFNLESQIIEAEYRALAHLKLAREIRKNPNSPSWRVSFGGYTVGFVKSA